MLELSIEKLLLFGKSRGFFKEEDERYVRNRILEILDYHDYSLPENIIPKLLPDEGKEDILAEIIQWAVDRGIIESDSSLYSDMLDSALMGAMLPRPSEVIENFNDRYRQSPKEATDYLYNLSIDSNYIRKSRTDKNISWVHNCQYGDIQITINISKPEKDIKEIQAEKNAPKTGYPLCLLCPENEGYKGRLNHPARQNLRIIPLILGGEKWFFQYSPYLYYDEHCILLNEKHTPMVIEEKTIIKMLDFLDLFPHYFVGSNADLPIVGGSILHHDHFQGGNYTFPMERAPLKKKLSFPLYPNVKGGILKWPLSVIRLESNDRKALQTIAGEIIEAWRSYSDEKAEILPFTKTEPHNTITPIARIANGCYQLDLVLRNNRCNEFYPEGIFHPHREIHNIKKENIGLIEVMGLAVLPGRLVKEMELIERYLLQREITLEEQKLLDKHLDFCKEIAEKYPKIEEKELKTIIKKEIGEKFVEALKHSGVYKDDQRGLKHFIKFISSIGGVVLEN
ncbi:UDP-glucose--hexose-1-phosphate uridylyltransferase [Anaerobranca gottschalkii]|uniref:Galactose-1-phosphate uridylyltransferase n=1 Tax=Anaerobranca gottschalkii DSM 13577 TaxID=1120990 RepID=A0A1H9ZM51_9FIRM|nr:UDP-glucose--hexose-1-phosphate uridylyltransferase [Anaerobranca gottschalkii]SES82428.1 UTP-hexose-1-phosphate uridylyltransferase [Anaerobranca gottschalkii DSM 13577]